MADALKAGPYPDGGAMKIVGTVCYSPGINNPQITNVIIFTNGSG